MTDEEMIADLRNERIALTARVNDRDMRIAWLKNEIYRLRSRIDDAWRCLNPVGQLARDYIDAAKADGDGWMNLKAQAEATKEAADVSQVVEPAAKSAVAVYGRCSTRCDHDSQCLLFVGHGDRHETDHGCICYDPRVPASEADADPATRGPIDGSGGGA